MIGGSVTSWQFLQRTFYTQSRAPIYVKSIYVNPSCNDFSNIPVCLLAAMPPPNANFQSRPNKHADRIRWNESWERDLKKSNYGSSRRVISFTGPGSDDLADVATSEVCQLQQDLCEYAVGHITNDDFAEQWKTLPQPRREELVLDALFQTSCAEPNVENYRQWCPEMTIAYLASNDGRGLLSLLLGILPEDLQETFIEPIVVNHTGVDQLLKNKKFRASATRYRKHRTYFISMVLFRVILAFVRIKSSASCIRCIVSLTSTIQYAEEGGYAILMQRQSSSQVSADKDEIPSASDQAIVQEIVTVKEPVRPQSHNLPTVHEVEISSDEEAHEMPQQEEDTCRPSMSASSIVVPASSVEGNSQGEEAHEMPQQEEETSRASMSTSIVVPVSSVEDDSPSESKTEGGHVSSHNSSMGAPQALFEPREQPSAKETALKSKCEELSNQCWKCEKLATLLLPGQDLKMCGKCAAIGRTIRYCSRCVHSSFYPS
jgi:hypothetical protein